MGGPILLLVVFVAIFLLVKYQRQLSDFFAAATTDDLFKKYGWNIMVGVVILVLVCVRIFYSGWETPSFTSTGKFAWGHWLDFALGSVVLFILLSLKEWGGIAPAVGVVWSLVLVFMFLVCPIFGLFESSTPKQATVSAPHARAQTICPDVSAEETRTCLITSEWSNWIKLANGARDNGKQMCIMPDVPFERKDVNGWTVWRFKTEEGQTILKYGLFSPNDECPDVL